MDQKQSEFLIEIEELIEQIFADLDELRERGTNNGRVQRDLIDRVFRRVHSVKGSAASCGLEVVSQIAHEFENLLEGARVGRVSLDHTVLDTCESAANALAESLALAASGIVEPSRRALFERLQAVASGHNRVAGAEAVLEKIPLENWSALTEAEKHRLGSVVEEGTPIFLVATCFDIANFDQEFFRLKEKLAECGEVISTSPTVDDAHPDKINFRVLYGSAADTKSLEATVAEFPDVVFTEIAGAGLTPEQEQSSTNSPVASVSSLANFVRTDIETLDRLISSTHQLFRSTSNAFDWSLLPEPSTREKLPELHEQIRRDFLAVEDELINLRMVSLAPTLQRAARAGRVAARAAGKEIAFEVAGGDLRLDKLLAEAIVDPLIHLVRNAIDHGIEDAATRTQTSKPKRGAVRIEAVSEGGRTRIRVVDDGRGIDPSLISKAAARLGILDDDSTLDFERSVRLIFRPGFTTNTKVSNLSGRGVGLDVVETAVEHVGGELRVSSKPANGTTFEIRLPVTFGLLEATIIVSGGHRYCIAASQILSKDEVSSADAGDNLSRVSMRDLLGQSPNATQTVSLRSNAIKTSQAKKNESIYPQVITCQLSDERDGTVDNSAKSVEIIVDEIQGTEKVLVRSLGRHAGRWYGVAGATELRDGTVALVLDLPRLIMS